MVGTRSEPFTARLAVEIPLLIAFVEGSTLPLSSAASSLLDPP